MKRSVQAVVEDEALVAEYQKFQETFERQIDGDGTVKSERRKTHDVFPLGGEPYFRLVRKDGQPLDADDDRKEQRKLDEAVRRRESENPNQRKRRLSSYQDKIDRRREMFEDLPKAFNFQIIGDDVIDGHPVWVIDAQPKPGYEPSSFRTSFLAKMKGKMWVSKQHERMVKVDVVTTGTVSIGWFLARLGPGTRIVVEQILLPDGVWVTKRFKIAYDVRIALIKQMRGETELLMWDFRKSPDSIARIR